LKEEVDGKSYFSANPSNLNSSMKKYIIAKE